MKQDVADEQCHNDGTLGISEMWEDAKHVSSLKLYLYLGKENTEMVQC